MRRPERIPRPRRALFAALAAALLATGAAAAELTARVDRRAAAVGDQVALTVTVAGESRDLPTPELPDIPGAQVSRGGTSQNFQMVNGAVSTSLTWTYYLRIIGDEDVTVPALEAEIDGRVLRTDPIVIAVSAAAAPAPAPERDADAPKAGDGRPGPGDDHFVTLTVDRETAWVGEQIVLVFRYHANPFARGLDRPQYTPPRTEGFWREDLPPNRNYQEIIAGQRYDITEIRYALFPTRPGPLTVEPAQVTIPVDPFADFFSSRRRRAREAPRRLETPAIRIDVKALPEPRPAGFSGVVSRRVDLEGTVSPASVPRGEPVTLSLSLGADGSLKSLDEVPWTPPEGVQAHEAGGGLAVKKEHGRLFSRLSQERVLVPLEEGPIELPPLEVVYFDPTTGTYETARRTLGRVDVTPGDRPVAGDSPARVLRAEIERLADDLRFVHPVAGGLRPRGAPLAATPLWWAALLTPAVLLVGLRWRLTREAVRRRDPLGVRRREAWRVARGRLRDAARAGGAAADAAVVQAIHGYVADRTGRAAAGLTSSDLRAFAAAIGREEAGARLAALVSRCEASRYGRTDEGPAGADAAREAETLLSELESAARTVPAAALRALAPLALAPLALAPLALAAGLAWSGAAAAQERGPEGPGADPARLMAEGVEAYTDGDVDLAVERFAAAAATTRDADVLYNLGNAHARRGELGLAVLNYLRARRLAPRDADVRANLEWVRSHTRDAALEGAPLPGGLRQVGAALGALSLDELALLTALAVWLAAGIVAAAWLRGGWTPGRRRFGLAALALVLAVAALFAWRWYDERVKDTAVVIVAEAEVRSGPDASFPVVFEVHDGLTLQVRAERDGWAQVTLGGEWNGWLPGDAVAHVTPDRDPRGGAR